MTAKVATASNAAQPTCYQMLSRFVQALGPSAIFVRMAAAERYVLLTGSDLGNRKLNLEQAAQHIADQVGRIIDRSGILESEPWGFESDTRFLNQALLIETEFEPEELLDRLLRIEKSMGRERGSRQWTSRTIDIDILCGENLIHRSDTLTIPHGHLHERAFALGPLCQLVPFWKHPKFGKTYAELLAEMTTTSESSQP